MSEWIPINNPAEFTLKCLECKAILWGELGWYDKPANNDPLICRKCGVMYDNYSEYVYYEVELREDKN